MIFYKTGTPVPQLPSPLHVHRPRQKHITRDVRNQVTFFSYCCYNREFFYVGCSFFLRFALFAGFLDFLTGLVVVVIIPLVDLAVLGCFRMLINRKGVLGHFVTSIVIMKMIQTLAAIGIGPMTLRI